MAVSNTRLSLFRRCKLKYYWSYIGKGPSTTSSRGLIRGKAGHQALADFYSGRTMKEAIEAAWISFSPNCEKSLQDMLQLDEVLHRYITWSAQRDRWKVLEVETTVEAEYGGSKLMGIWDLLIEVGGKTFIVDHKFQKSHSVYHLEVDTQVTHYLALAKLARVHVDGMLYNIVNLKEGQVKEVATRQVVVRPPRLIDAYLKGVKLQVEEMNKFEEQQAVPYPNWTKDCSWDCGFYRRCVDSPFLLEDTENG